MTTHDEVGASFSPTLQRGRMPAQPVRHLLGTRDGYRLVHHDHAQLRRVGMRHKSGDPSRPPDNGAVLRTLFFGLLLFGMLGLGSYWLLQKVRGGRGGPEEAAAFAEAQRAPIPPAPSPAPIEFVLPRGVEWTAMSWGVFLALVGIGLFFDPGPLRTVWLAVPAGLALLAIGGTLVALGWPVPDGKLTVSPEGVRRELSSGTEDIAWPRVAEVAVVSSRNAYRTGVAHTRWLVVTGVDGREFLRETLPLGPADSWQRMLDSVPAWCGRRIAHRTTP